ncbi:MAG: hypothetical protein ACRCUI_05455 [Polymorphobacter sp.]
MAQPAIAPWLAPAMAFGRVAPLVTLLVGVGEARYHLPVSSESRPYASLTKQPSGVALATSAYSSLAAGDRRAAARGFDDAAQAAPEDPRAADWNHEAQLLKQRWSGSAYIFARAAGPSDFASTALLGGGQSGATLAFTPQPLAARPLALTLRGAVAHDGLGVDGASAQGAFGARWQVMRGIVLSGEWLVASGDAAARGWTVRLAGGASGTKGRFEWRGYGEAGLVNANPFVAGQGSAGWRLPVRGVELVAGGGAWGAVQHDGNTVDRLDLGPSVRLRYAGAALPIELSADYRFRVAGNAEPGSGVAVTLATYF